MNKLELRMYSVVAYQLGRTIHAGIQTTHSVARYGRTAQGFKEAEALYNDWVDSHETVIVLDGGTTNTNPERLGTLNKYLNELIDLGVLVQPFYEPDLGDQLTSFALLVDERVFNKELYPDFNVYANLEKGTPEAEYVNHPQYAEWVTLVGGDKNVGLRRILNPLRLA